MSDNLKSALIRIRHNSTSTVVGSGFVIDLTAKTAMTCAHVIASASSKTDDVSLEGMTVKIDFPYLNPGVLYEAEVIKSFPKKENEIGDVAILQLTEELPARLEATKLVVADSYDGNEFKAIGFPRSFEEAGRWVDGYLQDELVNKKLQAIGKSELGYFVEYGFSGSPVFDKKHGGVIGMIVQVDSDPSVRVAFIVPVAAISDLYPELKFSDFRSAKDKLENRHIFISYSHDDSEDYAKRLHDDLELRGIPAWLDVVDIKDGMDWNRAIDEGLRNARAVVVILTPGSTLSFHVQSEWNDAISRFAPVIPLLFEDCNIPRLLNALNFIDFRENYANSLAEFISKLETLEDRHINYLENILNGYLEAQATSKDKQKFQDKIDKIRETISTLSGNSSDAIAQTIKEKRQRIAIELEKEQKRLTQLSKDRKALSAQRVVGQRIMDVSSYFRDRDAQRRQVGELLAKPDTRLISVIGQGGIGKTAMVSKILSEIEVGTWPYTDDKLEADGIIYLSTRTKGITLERIFLDCAEMLGGEDEKILRQIWTSSLDLDERINQLLMRLRDGLYIILLDNMEDLLNNEHKLQDDELLTFFKLSLQTPNNAKLLLTTREAIQFPDIAARFDNHVLMRDGLPEDDAIEVLRDLDPNNKLGIRDADEVLLREVARKVRGVPRALEVIASILTYDPFTNLEQLIKNDELFTRKEFVERLVRENYRRLDNDSRRVMEALAILGKPVPMVAVDFLLEPFMPGIDTRSILTKLINTYAVNFDRSSQLVSLHPIDRDYIYSQIPS